MKNKRQEKILEIISEHSVETQEELLSALKENGFSGTQATISRDIKELRIVKKLDSKGTYRYTVSTEEPVAAFGDRLSTIFRESIVSVDCAQNIVVLKTLPGLASAACSAVDSMQLKQIVGSIAGDDTAFLLLRDTESAQTFCHEMKLQTGK